MSQISFKHLLPILNPEKPLQSMRCGDLSIYDRYTKTVSKFIGPQTEGEAGWLEDVSRHQGIEDRHRQVL